MAFWNRKKAWDEEYDEYYAQDRGFGEQRERAGLRYAAHLLTIALVFGLFVGGVGFVAGVTMVERTLTLLATPLGVVWLGLLLLLYFSLLHRQRLPALAALGCWLVLTIGGNQWVKNQLASSLESRFQDIDPYSGQPFDVVVLLGGGTETNLGWRSEASLSGDRIVVAARMYHAGRASRIVCTGSQPYRRSERDLHPRQESAEILLGLNVPPEALLQLRGENTSQEMANLKTWVEQNPDAGRIGLLTSASHLPRAVRLAKANGLEVEPIPADFISGPFTPGPDLFVPKAENLFQTARLCKEYLAGLVGR